jgi:MoaA/NifB/PqqE/SkfB family radical SAM enzyme
VEDLVSSKKVRRPNELSLQESFQVLEAFALAGARTVNFVGAGEPMADPAFRELAAYVVDLGMKLMVFTNGIRIAHDDGLLEQVVRLDASVVLKHNSRDPALQDQVVGRRGYAKQQAKALARLVDAGLTRQIPTRLGVDVLAFRANLKELPPLHAWCRTNNVFPIITDYIPTGRTRDGKLQGSSEESTHSMERLTPSERRTLFDDLRRIDENFGVQRRGCSAYFSGARCTQILGVYVDIEGNIWPCVAKTQLVAGGGVSRQPLGNVRAGDSIPDVWRQHQYLVSLRRDFDGSCPYKA